MTTDDLSADALLQRTYLRETGEEPVLPQPDSAAIDQYYNEYEEVEARNLRNQQTMTQADYYLDNPEPEPMEPEPCPWCKLYAPIDVDPDTGLMTCTNCGGN